jgi:glycosyltransferase involved in cell wall biosynthesis
MKIALINNLFEPVARGGAERIVERQADILRSAGHKVIVVTTKPWGLKLPKNDDGIFRVGGLAGSFYHLDKIPKPLRLLWHWLSWCDLFTPWYVSLKLAFTGCQVAVGHNLTGLSLWLPRYLSACNIRYIQVLHDIQYLHPSGLMMRGHEEVIDSPLARLYQLMIRHWLKPASLIISPSKWLAETFIAQRIASAEKIRVIPNPIKTPESAAMRTRKPFTFLFIGQLEPHKGILELLRAFDGVEGEAVLTIAGDGSLRPQVEKMTTDNPKIKLLGRISQAEVARQISASSMLVIPSICYENLPTVIIDAFTQGLPVMGSEWGGIAELLDKGAGLLVNPLDVDNFTTDLQQAANLDERALKAYADCAYRKVADYGISAYSKEFLQLMES